MDKNVSKHIVHTKLQIEKTKNRFIGKKIFKKYLIVQFLNAGNFGAVFQAKILNDELVAVKIEDYLSLKNNKCIKNKKRNSLSLEIKVLKKLKGTIGFPQLLDYEINENEGIMVTDIFQSNLQELFIYVQNEHGDSYDIGIQDSQEFSLETTLMIGIQVIERLQALHQAGYIHRDIKPENLMIEDEKSNQNIIHLIDFGISKKYITENNQHIPYSNGNKFVGTYRFASQAAKLGLEQGRKDDLESLGYVMIYLYKGKLPYLEKKQAYSTIQIEQMCEDIHEKFSDYFRYLRNLQFSDKPNYNYLQSIFRNILYNEQLINDFEFDWNIVKNQNQIQNNLTMRYTIFSDIGKGIMTSQLGKSENFCLSKYRYSQKKTLQMSQQNEDEELNNQSNGLNLQDEYFDIYNKNNSGQKSSLNCKPINTSNISKILKLNKSFTIQNEDDNQPQPKKLSQYKTQILNQNTFYNQSSQSKIQSKKVYSNQSSIKFCSTMVKNLNKENSFITHYQKNQNQNSIISQQFLKNKGLHSNSNLNSNQNSNQKQSEQDNSIINLNKTKTIIDFVIVRNQSMVEAGSYFDSSESEDSVDDEFSELYNNVIKLNKQKIFIKAPNREFNKYTNTTV